MKHSRDKRVWESCSSGQAVQRWTKAIHKGTERKHGNGQEVRPVNGTKAEDESEPGGVHRHGGGRCQKHQLDVEPNSPGHACSQLAGVVLSFQAMVYGPGSAWQARAGRGAHSTASIRQANRQPHKYWALGRKTFEPHRPPKGRLVQ
eukprot:1161169-Pelagomonas_calceolata.AAC.3